MKVRMKSKTGIVLTGIDPAVAEIQLRLQSQPDEWLRTLQENPAAFKDVEKTVHHAFQQMADQLVAGLLAQATQADDFTQTAKKK
jgi:hypothetical protein